MTLKLILIRHAKSSWDNDIASDHDRTLNDRGRQTAPLIGKWLQDKGHVPALTLCSDAVRTKETWDLIAAELSPAPQLAYAKPLYLAPPHVILSHIQGADAPCVAVVAHNPGIAEFAHDIVEVAPDHPRFSDYPTGATTVVTFDADVWAEIQPGTGTVVDFTVPRDL